MNLLTDREFCAALVLSLGHFLWQGLVVAVLSAVATRSLKSASIRYAGLLLAFGVMAISPIVTLVMLAAPARSPSIAPVSPAIRPMAADTLVEVPVATRPTIDGQTDFDPTPQKSGPVPESPPAAQRAPGGFEGEAEPAVPSADSSWRWFAPLMTDVYLLGVMAMLLRLTVGLWGGWRLRRNSMPVSDGALLEALAQQAASLGMRFIPMLAYCERVAVPTVIGILKPTILLPLALTSRLSPDQIEAVLTHELAHLRRYDHLVNLAQRFVESLLFFHPAVWWLSHKIRVEREHCCDDLVVACGAMPLDYAKSLLRVAELSRGAMSRRSVSAVSLLATGQPSTLRQRIARLLGDSAAPQVRLAHSLFVFGLGGTCCLLAWGMTTIGWQLAAEVMSDHAHSTVVVEWALLVDEEVATQICDLLADPQKLATQPGDIRVMRVNADSLRELIAKHKNNAGCFQMNQNVFWMKTLSPSWRHTGISHIVSGLGSFERNFEKHQTSWTAFARYFLEQKRNLAHLTVNFQLSGRVSSEISEESQRVEKHTGRKIATLKGELKLDESLRDGQAAVVVAETDGLASWKPCLIVVYEAVQVPTDQMAKFESLTNANDWISRGPAGAKESVARAADWQARTASNPFAANEKWTRVLPDGGHVQLVGLGRPKDARFVWWTPDGEPLAAAHPEFDRNDTNEDLMAIVRIWETDSPRNQLRPTSFSGSFGIFNVDDRFSDAAGSQLILVPAVLDKLTGSATLNIGAGFGKWTEETPIAAADNATASISGVEFHASPISEIDRVSSNSPTVIVKGCSASYFWKPTKDFEFTVAAETAAGARIPTLTNPIVYANEPPNTGNYGYHFEYNVAAMTVKRFLIRSRPIRWTEFSGFATEPVAALIPPVEFRTGPSNEPRPFSAKLPGGVTVSLVGVGMPPSQTPQWWQANGAPLAKRPNESLEGQHSNGFPNQAECREIALEIVGLPKDHFVTARIGNNVSGVAFSNVQAGVKAYNIAAGPFQGEKATTVELSLALESLGPGQGIDAEGRKLADVDVSPDLKTLYEQIQPIRVEARGDHLKLSLKPMGDLMLMADWRLCAIDRNGNEMPPFTSIANGEGSIWSFKLNPESLARFEYRLRPYRYRVTFENVSLRGSQHTEVKVAVKTLSSGTFIARLPDGRSVELVGITKNTAPAKDGWKPNGQSIGEDVGYWPATICRAEGGSQRFTENGPHPEPRAEAIDLLFRMRGLKSQPSLTFDLAANGLSYSKDPLKDPYELRIVTERRGSAPRNSKWSISDGEMRVGLTDEPWGKWLQIDPVGTVLNPVTDDDLYRSYYEQIRIIGVEPHERSPNRLALVLRRPNNASSRLFDFEMRGIGADHETQWVMEWDSHGIAGTDLEEERWGLSSTEKAPLTRYEFRLRPYQHWVTFKGVSLEPEKLTEVSVESVSVAPPAAQSTVPPITESDREILRRLVRGGKIDTDSRQRMITQVAQIAAKNEMYANAILGELEKSCQADARNLRAVRDLVAVITEMFESRNETRWKSQLAQLAMNDSKEAAQEHSDAADLVDAGYLKKLIHHAYSADRSDIADFTMAARLSHHPASSDYLRDVLGNPESNRADPPAKQAARVGKWKDNVGGGWGDAKFVAAVGLAELNVADGVEWLLAQTRDNPFGIDRSLWQHPHSRDSRGSLRASSRLALAELFGMRGEPSFEQLSERWQELKLKFIASPVTLMVGLNRPQRVVGARARPTETGSVSIGIGKHHELVVWNHDSTQAFSIGNFNSLSRWKLDDGKWKATAVDQNQPYSNSIAASKKSDLVLLGTNTGTVEIWDGATLKHIDTLRPSPEHSVYAVAISDDDALVAGCGTDGTVAVFDRKSGQLKVRLGQIAQTRMVSLAFSPDGKTLAALDRTGRLNLWEIATAKTVASWKNDAGDNCSLSWSRDGRQLAMTFPGAVNLISAQAGSEVRLFNAPDEVVTRYPANDVVSPIAGPEQGGISFVSTPAIAPDQRSAASLMPNGSIGIWNIATSRFTHRLRAAPDQALIADSAGRGLRHLEYSRDGRRLACTTIRGDVVFWELGDLQAQEPKVSKVAPNAAFGNEKRQPLFLRFLGGPKNEPLAGIEVRITNGYGDEKKSFGSHKTDETGTVKVSLPIASYQLELTSEKELPYVPVEKLWNEASRGPTPDLSLNVTKAGVEKWLAGKRRDEGHEPNFMDGVPQITYTLLPACELTLRAVDVETDEGLPGAEFYKENAVGEDWARAIESENIGSSFPYLKPVSDEKRFTDKNGIFRRWVGANHGFEYGVQTAPSGYREVEPSTQEVDVRWGRTRAELVFKFRRIRFAARVEPEKKRIKLGEPLTFHFTVANHIAESRGLELGGDNRNRLGRPSSFEVIVVDNDARKMPMPDAGQSLGGISSNVLLKPKGETTVTLRLSDWATISQPGNYRVFVKRTLKLFPVKAQDGSRIEWSDAPELEVVEASCDFDVVATDEQSSAKGQEFKNYRQTIKNTDVSFEMVAISGGEFTMGSPNGELGRSADEGPQHRVRVQPFWMGKCEVTWDEFELWSSTSRLQESKRQARGLSPRDAKADAVTRPTPTYVDLSNGMGTHGYPAICISQHAAKKYCEWLTAKTGHYYRLPTEAEWEYACRAGSITAYSFGDDRSLLNDYAWHDGNCEGEGGKKYHPVGLKKPNSWGLHDMHGNVAEWVQDKYDADFYKTSPANQLVESPLWVASREYPRVTRGGSWMSPPSSVRSASRQPSSETWKDSDPQSPKSAWYITDAPFVGFRVLRPLRIPDLDERESQHLDAIVPTDVIERRQIVN